MDFKNADYEKINKEINDIDWPHIFNSNSPLGQRIDKFYNEMKFMWNI